MKLQCQPNTTGINHYVTEGILQASSQDKEIEDSGEFLK